MSLVWYRNTPKDRQRRNYVCIIRIVTTTSTEMEKSLFFWSPGFSIVREWMLILCSLDSQGSQCTASRWNSSIQKLQESKKFLGRALIWEVLPLFRFSWQGNEFFERAFRVYLWAVSDCIHWIASKTFTLFVFSKKRVRNQHIQSSTGVYSTALLPRWRSMQLSDNKRTWS